MAPGLLAAILVVSAAAAPVEKDGTWIEVRSPAFTVVTDAGASAARRTIERLEKIRAAMAAVMPSARLSGERDLLIVAARNEKSLRSLVPEWWEKKDGMRPSTVRLHGPEHVFLLVRTDLREDDDESYHAAYWGYASHLIDLNVPQLPLWARRGFSDFYARTTVQKDRVIVGRTAASHIKTLRQGGLMPVTALFAVDRQSPEYLDRDRLRRFDAESWALVHYLMVGGNGVHRQRLARFLVLLNQGSKAEGAAREAFGDPQMLDEALASYIRNHAFYMETIGASVETELDTEVDTTAERPLSSAEALTMRAAVHLASGRYPDAHASLDEALRLDPKLAWAHEIRAALAWAEDDPVLARAAVEQALDLEPGRALAGRLQKRVWGPPTVGGARRLCDAGELVACATLGAWLIDGTGTTADPRRGVALVEKACTGGRAEACSSLSWRYRQGKGVPVDGARAVALLEEACAAGDGRACLAAAADHQTGRGVSADPAAAARLFEWACTRGETTGCLALAWALQTGEGVPRDLERAAALYQDACHAGDGASCTRLGLLYVTPEGLPADHARAKELFAKGCEHGDELGCSNLEALAAATASATRARPRLP